MEVYRSNILSVYSKSIVDFQRIDGATTKEKKDNNYLNDRHNITRHGFMISAGDKI